MLAAIVFAVFGGPTFGLISGISNQDYSHLPPDMQPSWNMNIHLAEWIPAASNALWFDKSNRFLGPELATIVWCNIGNIASLIFLVMCTLFNFVVMLRK